MRLSQHLGKPFLEGNFAAVESLLGLGPGSVREVATVRAIALQLTADGVVLLRKRNSALNRGQIEPGWGCEVSVGHVRKRFEGAVAGGEG
jgi:hypothetical protein